MIPLFRPTLRRHDLEIVLECLVNDTLSTGTRCTQALRLMQQRTNAYRGIATREYHRAIELTFRALHALLFKTDKAALHSAHGTHGADGTDGISSIGIGISPLAPSAYFEVMQNLGITPLYIDVDMRTHLPTIATLEQALRERSAHDPPLPPVRSIVLDAPLGRHEDTAPFRKWCAEKNILPIEDISYTHRSDVAGPFAIAACEPSHLITAGGGAMILAQSEKGWDALSRTIGRLPSELTLPEMNGALAYRQLKRLNRFLKRRTELAALYRKALEAQNEISAPQGTHYSPLPACGSTHIGFPITVSGNLSQAIEYAAQKGIECARAYHNPYFESILTRYPIEAPLPSARAAVQSTLLFPLYPSLTDHEAKKICQVLRTLL